VNDTHHCAIPIDLAAQDTRAAQRAADELAGRLGKVGVVGSGGAGGGGAGTGAAGRGAENGGSNAGAVNAAGMADADSGGRDGDNHMMAGSGTPPVTNRAGKGIPPPSPIDSPSCDL
jgi:hypothetical protein